MTAHVRILPSDHEFVSEGNSSLLEAVEASDASEIPQQQITAKVKKISIVNDCKTALVSHGLPVDQLKTDRIEHD